MTEEMSLILIGRGAYVGICAQSQGTAAVLTQETLAMEEMTLG